MHDWQHKFLQNTNMTIKIAFSKARKPYLQKSELFVIIKPNFQNSTEPESIELNKKMGLVTDFGITGAGTRVGAEDDPAVVSNADNGGAHRVWGVEIKVIPHLLGL